MIKDSHSPLVSAEWLAERFDAAEIVVLDATYYLPHQNRDAQAEYLANHIPGACFFDIDVIADASNSLPHMLPTAEFFAQAMGQLGIEPRTHVIVYDNNDFMASARVWWTFRTFGHHRVSVLDGGLSRWNSLKLPLRSGEVTVTPRSFTATLHPALVRNLEEMTIMLHDPSVQIVDARSPGRFSGTEPEPRPGLRSGHIPGSLNVFFKQLIDHKTHCLKSVPKLEEEFQQAGVQVQSPIIATCGTGVTASILALALYCLGNEYVAVYDGSWTEWGSRQDMPIAP